MMGYSFQILRLFAIECNFETGLGIEFIFWLTT